MSKKHKIIGGHAYSCNNCEKCDGRPTLYWKEKDFNLCYGCLNLLSSNNKENDWVD